MSALRKAQSLPLEQRLTALTDAGERFASGTINGVSPTDYQVLGDGCSLASGPTSCRN
jgi:hypothetical protein